MKHASGKVLTWFAIALNRYGRHRDFTEMSHEIKIKDKKHKPDMISYSRLGHRTN